MDKFYHSVRLDESLCKGCINCIKRCPTEAIRVRGGKASINNKFCIDCGECIRVCPHHAKLATYDNTRWPFRRRPFTASSTIWMM